MFAQIFCSFKKTYASNAAIHFNINSQVVTFTLISRKKSDQT